MTGVQTCALPICSDNDALRQDNQKVHAQLDAMNDRLNQLTALVEQLSARK